MKLLALGLTLTICSWIMAWSNAKDLRENSFFPLWCGYILVINALCQLLYQRSLLKKMRLGFMLLFLISLPFWWFFEFINTIVHNWVYIFGRPISDFEFFLRASLSFTTVIPAVLSTAFFFNAILGDRKVIRTHPISIQLRWLFVSVLMGILSFPALSAAPQFLFPLVWIAPILIVEPLLFLLQAKSTLYQIQRGDWTTIISVTSAALFTGLFWEMWNFYSLPKWQYTIPYVGFLKVFEMPILGYLGYPFFGIIVYSYTIFMLSALYNKDCSDALLE
jgi:hypothetical protein